MRILKNVLFYLGTGFVSLIAFLFSFIEIRSIFAGDFTLFNSAATGFFAYLFRGLFFLSTLAFAVVLIVYKAKHIKIDLFLFIISCGLLGGSFISFAFYHFIVGLAVVVINLILLIITALECFVKKQEPVAQE